MLCWHETRKPNRGRATLDLNMFELRRGHCLSLEQS